MVAPRAFGPHAHGVAATASIGAQSSVVPEALAPGSAAGQRAFVALKLTFLTALEDQPGVDWLRLQVLGSEAPGDLWLLRGPVLDALTGPLQAQRARRQMVRRGLESFFPDLDPGSAFMPV